jgi:LPXTG-site transpeptidase (sortase) family protein
MDSVHLIHARHIESLIVPSCGEILISYLSHGTEKMNTEVRISSCAGRLDTERENTRKKIKSSPFAIQYSVFKANTMLRPLASALLIVSLGGITGPLIPEIRLESLYALSRARQAVIQTISPVQALPPSAPVLFNPLVTQDGTVMTPVDSNFSVIVPKVGINAPILADVDPKKEESYLPALAKGVAHASTSFLPDQDGTVYLFSHSTNFDWFVQDLNAVFYHLKSLDAGDLIVVVYKNVRYTYRLREKKVVAPNEISYLIPQHGTRTLILQTCWPPGSTAQRLLLFADLFDTQPFIR